LIVEELYREFEDENNPFYLALLDAKSAFDVVVLNILFRKLYMLGINPATWAIIDELHRNTRSCVKWNDCISDEINVQQGVKQSGLLSADLCKLYIEVLLHTFQKMDTGAQISDITVNVIACADDIALIADDKCDLQILLNTTVQYSTQHHYTLQLQKSVIIPINQNRKCSEDVTFKLNNENMPITDKSSHLGIVRSTTRTQTENETIEQNIAKARRTSYSLMSIGLHANSGLDSTTAIAIIRCYILPTLAYGLEMLQPRSQNMSKLEQFLKALLKRILSLPPNAPDPTLYVISDLLPVQAQIDIK
jgi:hypothetical protein